MSPETDKFMRDAAEEFYRAVGYMTGEFPRWKHCTRKVLDYPAIGMSLAVSHEYQKLYVKEEQLTEVSNMVDDLRESFDKILEMSTWMDDVTKANAASKADNFLILLGSPEMARDARLLDEHYDGLKICRYDHFGNMNRLRSFNLNLIMMSIAAPRDRNQWTQSTLLVNAFYNALNNRLTFPIAMMAAPFYTGDELAILDYSRIGMIIGHEITHAFDSNGHNFDETGQLTNWWTPETLALYKERTKCFEKQYSSYIIPELNLPVLGSLTVGENVADNGGLINAYYAYQALKRRDPHRHQNPIYTNDQLFFIGYGTMWCRTQTAQSLMQYYKTSAYPPNRFRVIGAISNMPEFTKAFSCPAGSPMNPEIRCRLW